MRILTLKKNMPVGKMFRFTHKRKGVFVGTLLAWVDGDGKGKDAEFLEIRIATASGTGQERLANSFIVIEGKKQPAPVTEKLIRSSLLTKVVRYGSE